MILIDGKKIAAELREELRQEVVELKAKHNKIPGLTVILIGDPFPSPDIWRRLPQMTFKDANPSRLEK